MKCVVLSFQLDLADMQNYICVRRRGYIWSFTWGGLARKKSNRKTCVSFKSYQWFLGTKLMEVLWICYEFLHRCLLHPLACVVNSSNQFPIYWVEEFYRIQGGCISRVFSSFLNFKLACCTIFNVNSSFGRCQNRVP